MFKLDDEFDKTFSKEFISLKAKIRDQQEADQRLAELAKQESEEESKRQEETPNGVDMHNNS